VNSSVRRSAAFAAVGSLVLATPLLGRATAIPFAAIAVAALALDSGTLFELFARPADRREGRLAGLAGFAFATTALALLATVPAVRMPLSAFVASVLVLCYGDLGRALARGYRRSRIAEAAGFVTAAFLAASAGQTLVAVGVGAPVRLPTFAFLAAAGALAAALIRSVLRGRDDPLLVVSTGLLLWLFESVELVTDPTWIGIALAVTVVLGYTSFALGTASVPGMLAGMVLTLLALVLGGLGWFAVLVSFFVVGGLSTKFRYEEKRERGIAEANEGARGSGNVLGNAGVALLALLVFAASPHLSIPVDPIRLAFAGSIAAAMSDTLSSEIGGLYDEPRLVTTFERVDPGTDGAVTWQGELAGLSGAVLVAAIAYGLLDVSVGASAAIVAGGFVGMTVDSVLGATVEGDRLGNQAVNFLATLSGALASGLLWLIV
jgi:uncharacterized protein (TIGR00297 family)